MADDTPAERDATAACPHCRIRAATLDAAAAVTDVRGIPTLTQPLRDAAQQIRRQQ